MFITSMLTLTVLHTFVCFCFFPFQLYACGVSNETLAVTAANAENFQFKAYDWLSDIDLHVGDNALLIFNESGVAGKEEFSK